MGQGFGGAQSIVLLKTGVLSQVVPGTEGQEILGGDVPSGDGTAGVNRDTCVETSRRNTAWAKSVIEGDERLPVHGLVNQTGTAADHGRSFAVGIPRKSEARREVLVIGVIEAADLIGARVHLH